MSSRYEVASHVFTVEFHVYLFHLLDVLPDWDLPKHPGLSNGFNQMELEDLEVQLINVDGSTRIYQNLKFPKLFSDVLDFYLYDLDPIFFPCYEYHILSKSGVVLKHAVLQTCRHEAVTSFFPEIMLNIEMNELRTIKWKIGRGIFYSLELTEVIPFQVPRAVQSAAGTTKKANRTRSGVDLRPLCFPIKNQGDLGTCGVSAVTSFLEFLSGHSLSVMFLYYVTRVYLSNYLSNDDSGVQPQLVLDALANYGICRREHWPYIPSKFMECPPPQAFEEAQLFRPQATDFLQLTSFEEMKATLDRELIFFVDINFAPDAYGRGPEKTGIVKKPPAHEVEYCDHTVMVVGYNDDTEYLIIQNSWGTHWGQNGYGYVPYEYITRGLFKNAYTWKGDKQTLSVQF